MSAERVALRIVQIGAIAIVIAASTETLFDLDRFFVPKEVVLHVTAALAGVFAIGAMGRIERTKVDKLLILYLLLSAVGALFAQNGWVAGRALAISASSVLLFWVGRAVGGKKVLNAIALAVVVAASTALLQAYGLHVDWFSLNRAPGGTLGNRNFIAHVCAFGFPMVLLSALRTRKPAGYVGVALVMAALVLTRSRAAWLASGVIVFAVLVSMVLSAQLRRVAWRVLGVILVALAGAGLALLLPNALKWRSDNPYLESMRSIGNYQEGSGHGRLIQYTHSLKMALWHPLLGVAAGNWPVEYAKYAARNDPSMDQTEAGVTSNPWPSSDWVAFAAERGFTAMVLMAIVFLTFALEGLRRLRIAAEPEEALLAMTLITTAVGAVVTGAFDAVLLLALPALLVWTTLGALYVRHPLRSPAAEGGEGEGEGGQVGELVLHRYAPVVLVVACALGAARSIAQLTAMEIYAGHSDRASLLRASAIDPGNYRLHLRLARGGKRTERCEHALAAHELYPHAEVAKSLARGCGEKR